MSSIFSYAKHSASYRQFAAMFVAFSLVLQTGYVPAAALIAYANEDHQSSQESSMTSASTAEGVDAGEADNTENATVDNHGDNSSTDGGEGVSHDNSSGHDGSNENAHKGHDGSENLAGLMSALDESGNDGDDHGGADTPHLDTLLAATGSGTEDDDENDHDHHKNTKTFTPQKVKIVATKVVCDNEADLPNWGLGGPNVTASTAADFVEAHPACHLESGWQFQWGYADKDGAQGVDDPGRDLIGEANGNTQGTATGLAYDNWKTFGVTNSSGVASVEIENLAGSPAIWIREVLMRDYIPFTFDGAHQSNANNVSAEIYCHTDVLNYDNFDYVASPALGQTYYCVAFNAKKPIITPTPTPAVCPFIASEGNYVIDFGTAKKIVSNSTHEAARVDKDVNIPPATYEVSLYSYDSYQGRASVSQSREQWYLRIYNGDTLLTTSAPIDDLADNVTTATKTQYVGDVTFTQQFTHAMAKHYAWQDMSSDHDLYPVCAQLKLKRPANQKPVITVTGENPTTVLQGSTYTDLGATAADPEDGNITANIVATGSVNTNILGDYTITYNVSDSKGLAADTKTRAIKVTARPQVTINATKIVCTNESDLPNWGNGGPNITASTASDWVASHSSCRLEPNWKFQWGFASKTGNAGVKELPRDFIGEANGSNGTGSNTGTNYNDWKTSGATNAGGVTTIAVTSLEGASAIWVREVLKSGYIPFTFDGAHQSNANNVSAEIYCHTDVLNYDNFDYVASPAMNQTYYCVAFNAEKNPETPPQCRDGKDNDGDGLIDYPLDKGCANTDDNDENDPPVITVNPAVVTVVVGATYSDSGVTASDPEDGNITTSIIRTGDTVVTTAVATFTIIYNVKDSKNVAAVQKTRTVKVVAAPPQCSDGKDNDGDGKIDWNGKQDGDALYVPDDGCDGPEDNDENARPVITVTAPNPTTITRGSLALWPGATASDLEDGDRTAFIVTTGTVDRNTIGSYTIRYNVVDSKGLAAVEKTRTVIVATQCSDGIDNDGDGKIDFGGTSGDTGCDNPTDDNENTPPVITLLGANPMNVFINTTFVDPGATALDAEDGPITPVRTGTVNTAILGTYTLTYNATDSKGATATPVTRTVNVNPTTTQCNDGIDNDQDGTIDFGTGTANDKGCDNPQDNDENAKPVITVLGDNPVTHRIGTAYVDAGATASDLEDGDRTAFIVATGTVNATVLGTYTITYNVVDTKGLAADPKTRTVKVVSACSDGIDNDQDGTIDFPEDTGCDSTIDDSENEKPVITLLGEAVMTIVQGNTFVDPGKTALDKEDGEITPNVITTGTVNTSAVGTYTLNYNVADSKGLAADQKSRTITVTSGGCTSNCGGGGTPPICSNGADDDGDGLADYPRDPGCESSQDNDETDTGPVITVIGENPITVTQNTTFTDPGATAHDPEDGDITSNIVKTGAVDTSTVGSYVITYNVSDAQGHAAAPKTRTVNVTNGGGGCSQNCGGGGGGGPTTLSIYNERATRLTETTATVTWNTNLNADSRVVHGATPVSTLGIPPNYGYTTTNTKDAALMTTHSMTITGISADTHYFRAISDDGRGAVISTEVSIGSVLGETLPEACYYLRAYLRLGYNNDASEVIKLQTFLKNEEGFTDLAVTGFFGPETDKAVRTFQERYRADVLTPWGLPSDTGYVYYTTQKKVNEIHCKRLFPMTDAQMVEIKNYFDLMDKLRKGTPVGVVGTSVVAPGAPVAPVVSEANGDNHDGGAVAMTDGSVGGVGANKPTAIPGKIALKDLLATIPSVGSASDTGSDTMGEVAGAQIDKKSLLATGATSLAQRLNVSMETLAVLIFFVLLALILLVAYVYLSIRAQREAEEEAGLSSHGN